MKREPNDHYTFLLRLWPDAGSQGTASWRATLEDARSGERLGFASLEQLFAHLMELAEVSSKTQTEGTDPQQSAR